MSLQISLTAFTDDPEATARIAEQFARTAAGLALDGIECHIALEQVDVVEVEINTPEEP